MAHKEPAVILPGHIDNQATYCARFLEECILESKYWDVCMESRPPDLIRDGILEFLLAIKK